LNLIAIRRPPRRRSPWRRDSLCQSLGYPPDPFHRHASVRRGQPRRQLVGAEGEERSGLNPSSDQTTNKTPRTLRWTQRLNGQFANLQYYLLVRISNPRRAEKLRRAEKIINTCSLFSGVADYKTTYDYMTTTHSANLEMRCLVHCVQHMSSHEINTYICVTKCVISVQAKVRYCNSMKLAATFRSPRFELMRRLNSL
jgi:hypothetical protein